MIGAASLTAAAAGVTVLAVPGTAGADPVDINTYAPAKPSEYTVQNGEIYQFAAPDGVTCVIDKKSGRYGCSGPIPAAPGGANVVTGALGVTPGFANAAAPLYGTTGDAPPKPLAPNTRL